MSGRAGGPGDAPRPVAATRAVGSGSSPPVLILGAGPAGLTAALELTRRHIPVRVLEQDSRYVGGIARTVEYRGYRFDLGGHRFFSKNAEIEALWGDILGDQLITCKRRSRILYRGRFFDYPIRAGNALINLGPLESTLCLLSYARARMAPVADPETFEDWVTNQFGRRLFRIFFKTYTEKVWGISTAELSADWAAQRIKGLDLGTVLGMALGLLRRRAGDPPLVKTLIDEFRYPRLGPGQCWELVAAQLAAAGAPVQHDSRVVRMAHKPGSTFTVWSRAAAGAAEVSVEGGAVVSSLPLRELILMLEPAPPDHVCVAARQLKYRDFLTVALIVDRASVFEDNWIYIHDPSVAVGRIQNFKNWSSAMSADPARTCLGLEYFCFEDDGLWSRPDSELVSMAATELARLGLCGPGEVRDGVVVRQPKAYPVYDEGYQQHVQTIRGWLETEVPGLWCVGRNGMHKYNNQDHSMMTALIVARNLAGEDPRDPWRVNADAEYLEGPRDGEDASGRLMPRSRRGKGQAGAET